MRVLAVAVGLAVGGTAWGHPLDSCDVHRGSMPYNTTVTFSCGAHQVSERTYVGRRTREQRLEQFHEELEIVGSSLGTGITWNTASIELGGVSRPVAQYTLKGADGVLRTGLVASKDPEGSQLVDCSTPDTANATVCRDMVDAVLTHGLPDGVTHLPLPKDVKKAQVLGRDVKVVIGCKAAFVFDDAIHIKCADGEMLFGSDVALMEGVGDPIGALKSQLGETPDFQSSDKACTVGGVSARCWRGEGTVGGVRQLAHTAEVTVGGQPAMLLCTQTAVGAALHVQCAQVMSLP